MCIFCIMQRTRNIDYNEVAKWVVRVGGLANATLLIMEILECSASKADKIAAGRYPSTVTPCEQIALAELMCRPRSDIFPLVGAKGKSRVS